MSNVIEPPCKLKKCPWCKVRPLLVKDEHMNYMSTVIHTYYIKCINPNCRINPQTRRHNDVYCTRDMAINKVCEDWNSRGDK